MEKIGASWPVLFRRARTAHLLSLQQAPRRCAARSQLEQVDVLMQLKTALNGARQPLAARAALQLIKTEKSQTKRPRALGGNGASHSTHLSGHVGARSPSIVV
jgi:hypothetical protein